MDPIIQQMLVYALFIAAVMFGLNLLTRGFLFTYINVKGSRGKKLLARIVEIDRTYYQAGHIQEGYFIVKRSSKDKARYLIPKDIPVIYQELGINCIEINGEDGTIYTPNREAVSGYDPVKVDQDIVRALQKPATENPLLKGLVIMGIFNLLLALGIIFFVFTINNNVELNTATLAAILAKVSTGFITGGATP